MSFKLPDFRLISNNKQISTDILRAGDFYLISENLEIKSTLTNIKNILHSALADGTMPDSFKGIDLKEIINNILSFLIPPNMGVSFTYKPNIYDDQMGDSFCVKLKKNSGMKESKSSNEWAAYFTCTLTHMPALSSVTIDVLPHGVTGEQLKYLMPSLDIIALFFNFKNLVSLYSGKNINQFNESMKNVMKEISIKNI